LGNDDGEADPSLDLTLDSPKWFFFIDPDFTSGFQKTVYYYLADVQTGEIEVYQRTSWPMINGLTYYGNSKVNETSPDLVKAPEWEPEDLQVASISEYDDQLVIEMNRRGHDHKPDCPDARTHALFINGYNEDRCIADVERAKTLLGRGGIPPAGTIREYVPPTANAVPTVQQYWNDVCDAAQECDTVLFYASSHGTANGKIGLVMSFNPKDGEPLHVRFLRPSDLDFDRCKACHIIFILDFCHAAYWINYAKPILQAKEGRKAWMLAASSDEFGAAGYSYFNNDWELIHAQIPEGSFFTRAFVDAFEYYADNNPDDPVDLTTAYYHAQTTLQSDTYTYTSGARAQHPRNWERQYDPEVEGPCGIPAAPQGVQVFTHFGDNPRLRVIWQANEEEDLQSYTVYRKKDAPGPPWEGDETLVTEPEYNDIYALPGETWYYAVTAEDDNGDVSDFSEPAGARFAPSAPTGLLLGVDQSEPDPVISLLWNVNMEEGIDGYNVYRRQDSAGPPWGDPLNGSPLSATEYEDTAVEDGETWYYMVTAVAAGTVESDPSQTVSGEIPTDDPPAAPQGLLAAADYTGETPVVQLVWNANSEEDLDGYNVYRHAGSPGPPWGGPLNTEPLTTTEYTDMTVTEGPTWWYVVTAVDQRENESDFSDASSANLQTGNWEITVVDDNGAGDPTDFTGMGASVAIDPDGNPAVIYYRGDTASHAGGALHVMLARYDSGNWNIEYVESGDFTAGTLDDFWPVSSIDISSGGDYAIGYRIPKGSELQKAAIASGPPDELNYSTVESFQFVDYILGAPSVAWDDNGNLGAVYCSQDEGFYRLNNDDWETFDEFIVSPSDMVLAFDGDFPTFCYSGDDLARVTWFLDGEWQTWEGDTQYGKHPYISTGYGHHWLAYRNRDEDGDVYVATIDGREKVTSDIAPGAGPVAAVEADGAAVVAYIREGDFRPVYATYSFDTGWVTEVVDPAATVELNGAVPVIGMAMIDGQIPVIAYFDAGAGGVLKVAKRLE
jgi:fibronectin type 3 domain-containing protein